VDALAQSTTAVPDAEHLQADGAPLPRPASEVNLLDRATSPDDLLRKMRAGLIQGRTMTEQEVQTLLSDATRLLASPRNSIFGQGIDARIVLPASAWAEELREVETGGASEADIDAKVDAVRKRAEEILSLQCFGVADLALKAKVLSCEALGSKPLPAEPHAWPEPESPETGDFAYRALAAVCSDLQAMQLRYERVDQSFLDKKVAREVSNKASDAAAHLSDAQTVLELQSSWIEAELEALVGVDWGIPPNYSALLKQNISRLNSSLSIISHFVASAVNLVDEIADADLIERPEAQS